MKLSGKKLMVAVVGALAVAAVGMTVVSAANVAHQTVLTGTVVSVVPVGTAVKEGDTLVTVKTVAGPMAASRATVDGVVSAVKVVSGDQVTRGNEVVVVNSK